MIENENFLFYVQRESYTIQIKARENGYNFCSYRIVTADEYRLWEPSTKKIFQRLLSTLSLYIAQFNESEINSLVHDLKVLSNKLKISEEYGNSEILKLGGNLLDRDVFCSCHNWNNHSCRYIE